MNRKTVCVYCIILLILATTVDVYAHNGDIYNGGYTSSAPCNQTNLRFYIESSAQNSLLNSSVYNAGLSWNGISSHVSVSVAYYAPGLSSTGFYSVIGASVGTGVRGETIPYNSSGNETNFDSNWQRVVIKMNTNTAAYNGSASGYNATDQAKKTFIHEVGHALKLKHPIMQFGLDGHNYPNGRPWAVMNEGLINGSYIPAVISQHDRSNLIAKWGA